MRTVARVWPAGIVTSGPNDAFTAGPSRANVVPPAGAGASRTTETMPVSPATSVTEGGSKLTDSGVGIGGGGGGAGPVSVREISRPPAATVTTTPEPTGLPSMIVHSALVAYAPSACG